MTLEQQIFELEAELRHCHLTRRERTGAEAELGKIIAKLAEIEREFSPRKPEIE